ncbi:PD-(D/E)XK nuclease family protein [Moritella sp. 5]|uniref:PD-(D/E)XK nuclease family protein n=1 Tax=Moritella sp. 5 TaxID=2746231 RepID=UPI001BAD360A|nr:PD-(D/E)XK nuclease family protein [Moritella sp. 5]QUM81137.1 PD-(D/E)XK nuclease family protein [Moritella sp. 5]
MTDTTRNKRWKKSLAIYSTFNEKRQELKGLGANDYSLINSLLKVNDEVRLHTRFIYSMINPKSLHYCGHSFLNHFLDLIKHPKLCGFINLTDAEVLIEKDNIDLLIHDNNHFMIIENKLNAGDGKHQISRYITAVKEKFNIPDSEMSTRISVIYLSKKNTVPQPQSYKGFKLEKDILVWQKTNVDLHKCNLSLSGKVEIPFYHYPYFSTISPAKEGIDAWVGNCSASCNKTNVKNAFIEYQLIISKINKNKSWKKIMTLSDYSLNLPLDEEKEMYDFMVEAKTNLVDFISRKINKSITESLEKYEYEIDSCITTLKDGDITDIALNEFTSTHISNWINKIGQKSEWKNVGFVAKSKYSDNRVYFLLADWHIYLAKLDGRPYKWDETNRISIGQYREKIMSEPKGLYDRLDQVDSELRALCK